LVTEPGTTSLLARQLLSEDGLVEAEDRFGSTTFIVLPLGDILDDWLTAPSAERAPIDALARLMVLEVLLSVGRLQQESAERVVPETGGTTMADLCQQAFTHIERLGRLRDAGAPEIVRRCERSLLRATAQDLLMAAATKFPPRMASSA
jgi:hypothetical protein